jgi:tight adherence protein B
MKLASLISSARDRPRTDMGIAILGCTLAGAIGWLFFRHALACVLLAPGGIAVVPLVKAIIKRRRRSVEQLELSRFLQSLISTMYAGHSLENAFREIEKEMRRESWQESKRLLEAVTRLNQRVALGESVERAFVDVVRAWQLEDMQVLADTLGVYRRSGGNLLLHLRRTAELLIRKIQAEQEIQVIVARKQMEALMMNLAPYAMIGLVLLGSPDYAAPLFSGGGRLVMLVALVLIIVGHVWTYRMLKGVRL